MVKYSVIIPTLNEEKFLPRTLQQLKSFNQNLEIIVTDGGSIDKTVSIAQREKIHLVASSPGRGIQQKRGAQIAKGEILIFLHVDTILPKQYFQILESYTNNPDFSAATFRLKFDEDKFALNLYSWFSRFESIFTTFGDQTIIIRKDLYNRIGGFPEVKIFDDVIILRELRRRKALIKIPHSVITSARRFRKHGLIKTQLLNGWFIVKYLLGYDVEEIYNSYNNKHSS
ncbi:MAG: TIGR04283 family arsenosugar biosynthesis glycosyltransferase [Melioribacteraceae bacterium]|nr:TIGR04283 family arsenosugar biosynthesis glycosyltransferase [Melioribacteraceae bacterium]MCF8262944.1 TIGR04283 family arsenosugar biosynthesis glycosyltransferase [Melioribacteraceae bacterium]MCF8413111.1 TIGR04283 family arsenosugar biosynthesis glycosyltransferase [Melioribacteraceae bacterium]MCF8430623.1 TIGR04283 family arsenosugar biosynthesis glycosyltransferase [Melioribacteraceae bacterium]